MPQNKLYIIGNGFDLFHGIPSKLENFRDYVAENNDRVFDEVQIYLPCGEDWSTLEQSLADMDPDALSENLGHFAGSYGADDWSDSMHGDYQYEVENTLERLSEGLLAEFTDWVMGLPIPPSSTTTRLKHLDASAQFFSFNYTNTLNSVYNVSITQVLFIHGSTDKPDEKFVLGHGWKPEDRKPLIDPEHASEMDVRIAEGFDLIDGFFSDTFKRSAELIEKHKLFFDGLDKIDEVHVLGHSLNHIDAAYYHALLLKQNFQQARWFVTCLPHEEWISKLALLKKIGVPIENAIPMLWEEL